MTFWNLNLEPGQAKMVSPFRRIRLTNMSIKEVIEIGRTTVQILKPGQTLKDAAVVGALVPGRTDFAAIDVTLAQGVPMIIATNGPNPVSLIGWASDDENRALSQSSSIPSIGSVPSTVNFSGVPTTADEAIRNGKRRADDVDGPAQSGPAKRPNTGPSPEEAEGSGSTRPKRKTNQKNGKQLKDA
ncbi:hypothetical protein VKT23_019542 [Stygiomarasmius scandens]|uniref:Nucleoplasmin-like domain-containing protein n=1 Tax=Marasmiellus scandens TaxID=2682957 RepID=A0ABR1IL65_9AGAR